MEKLVRLKSLIADPEFLVSLSQRALTELQTAQADISNVPTNVIETITEDLVAWKEVADRVGCWKKLSEATQCIVYMGVLTWMELQN